MVTSCSDETTIPTSGTKSVYVVRAVATATDNSTMEKSISIPVNSDSNTLPQIRIGRSQIRQNQLAEIVIDADISIAVLRTDIYVDGSSIEACASAIRQCRWSDILAGDIGTVHTVYGIVKDTIGRTYKSQEKTITIADNDSPNVTIRVGKDLIYPTETVDITINASDDDGIVAISLFKDGTLIATCKNAVTCLTVAGPWAVVGTTYFSATAEDALDAIETSDSIAVTIQAPAL